MNDVRGLLNIFLLKWRTLRVRLSMGMLAPLTGEILESEIRKCFETPNNNNISIKTNFNRMSQQDNPEPAPTKTTFENKYKRALSLNDSWNLGEEMPELEQGK